MDSNLGRHDPCTSSALCRSVGATERGTLPNMATSSVSTGILVGAGSIGRAHARAVADRYQRFYVIDPNEAARDAAAELLSGDVSCYESLDGALLHLQTDPRDSTAIVANWGPDHADSFERLCRSGVPRVLVEKPMASSAASARHMVELANQLGVRLIVGNSRRYNGTVDFIQAQFRKIEDVPESIVVHGGALCTVTNGMHWLDLACAVFGELPISVAADLHDGRINPRAPHLGYWDGVATWRFPNARRLTISYSNASSVGGQLAIYGRVSRLDIDDHGKVWIADRDPDAVSTDPRVTRYGPVSDRRTMLEFRPPTSATASMLDHLESVDPLVPDASEHAAVMEAMLASLYASEAGIRVSLPLDPTGDAATRDWAAS